MATSRVLSTMLYGVTTGNIVVFTAAAVAVSAISLAATYLPTRQAMRVDPMVTLRSE